MTARLRSVTTRVPLDGGEDVTIDPGYPWPSAYRGSRYSVVHSNKHRQLVLAWKYDDLQIFLEPPDGLVEAMQAVGKSDGDGTGSIRITAGGEVLTKVWADHYNRLDLAPVSNGWVSVYLGKLDGDLGFTNVDINPRSNGQIAVWEGLPFNHGETWTVGYDGSLLWKWEGYRFGSAFEHDELIERYEQYRSTAGRLYVNEYGQIWVNLPTAEVREEHRGDIQSMFTDWQRTAKRRNDTSVLHLVRRRLEATGGGDPEQGHLPVHIGHVSDFDDGVVPRAVVTDSTYFAEVGRKRED